MHKTLIVRLRNWIGDVVLGIPALKALEAAGFLPVLVGKRWSADLFEAYGWPVHHRADGLRKAVLQYKALATTARADEPGFDTHINALTFATSFSSALEMRMAGLRACGYAYEGRSMLLARAPAITLGGHALTSYWELAQQLLGTNHPPPKEIEYQVSQRHRQLAHATRERHAIKDGYVIICPFAGGTFEKLDKRWPLFAQFNAQLSDFVFKSGRQLVIVPGPGEEAIAQRDYSQAIMLSGVGVGEYSALIEQAALIISNDTGPGHIAAALGRPLISVLGPTKPEQWAPWGSSATILRRWPGWPSVEEVMQASRAAFC
jgi:ADP-heptose:LPS heptosyltransferase